VREASAVVIHLDSVPTESASKHPSSGVPEHPALTRPHAQRIAQASHPNAAMRSASRKHHTRGSSLTSHVHGRAQSSSLSERQHAGEDRLRCARSTRSYPSQATFMRSLRKSLNLASLLGIVLVRTELPLASAHVRAAMSTPPRRYYAFAPAGIAAQMGIAC